MSSYLVAEHIELLPSASYHHDSSFEGGDAMSVCWFLFFQLVNILKENKKSSPLATVLFSTWSAGIINMRVSVREPYFTCDL